MLLFTFGGVNVLLVTFSEDSNPLFIGPFFLLSRTATLIQDYTLIDA